MRLERVPNSKTPLWCCFYLCIISPRALALFDVHQFRNLGLAMYGIDDILVHQFWNFSLAMFGYLTRYKPERLVS
jgi:hypothetical protein